MQKSNKKKQNHTSHIALHTSQKGITLIALIITIIVMLILVGVTINVALNGGLFTKAEQATKETEEKAILEEMLAIMEITDDGKINSGEIIKKMRANYPELKYDESTKTATITGKLGTYNYIVSETEIKIGESDVPPQENEELKKYVLGEDGAGRDLLSIFNGREFLDDENTEDIDEKETLGVESIGVLTENYIKGKTATYVNYKNKVYKIIFDESTLKTEKLELVYEPKGREGQTTEEGWTIIYDNETTVEAVSPEAVGDLRLGYAEGTTDSTMRLTESMASYNSAISIINNYCEGLEGLPTNIGVRSVGSAVETNDMHISTNLETWHNSQYNAVIKKEDKLYEQDLIRMCYWGVNSVGKEYWMASRYMRDRTNEENFCVRIINVDGSLSNSAFYTIFTISKTSAIGNVKSYAVRPVITISK